MINTDFSTLVWPAKPVSCMWEYKNWSALNLFWFREPYEYTKVNFRIANQPASWLIFKNSCFCYFWRCYVSPFATRPDVLWEPKVGANKSIGLWLELKILKMHVIL